MTATLERAFKKASALPAALQEQLAGQLLDDMAGEAAWDKTLQSDASQTLLDELAKKALNASKQGKTHRKGFGL